MIFSFEQLYSEHRAIIKKHNTKLNMYKQLHYKVTGYKELKKYFKFVYKGIQKDVVYKIKQSGLEVNLKYTLIIFRKN